MIGKKPEEPPEPSPELQDLLDTSLKYNDRNLLIQGARFPAMLFEDLRLTENI